MDTPNCHYECYAAEQIIGHLRQAEILISEGKTIGEAARQLSISEQHGRACDWRSERRKCGPEGDRLRIQGQKLKRPVGSEAVFPC